MYKAIGKRIHDRRRLKGMTQSELAEKCEISVSFIGHIERGTRVLSVATLLKISAALNCSVDHLLGVTRPHETSLPEALRIAANQLEKYGKNT